MLSIPSRQVDCLSESRQRQMVVVIVNLNSNISSVCVPRRQQRSATAAAVIQNDVVLVRIGPNQVFAQLNRFLRREDCRVRLLKIQNALRVFLCCTFALHLTGNSTYFSNWPTFRSFPSPPRGGLLLGTARKTRASIYGVMYLSC